MFTQKVKVTYRDGKTVDVVTDQGDVQVFEAWALRRGIAASRPDRSLIQEAPVTFLRVAAWSAVQRSTGARVEFDTWAETVADVSPEEVEEAPPSPETTPEEQLPI
jgi:hypothetical protein